jgi:hypothetical protein
MKAADTPLQEKHTVTLENRTPFLKTQVIFPLLHKLCRCSDCQWLIGCPWPDTSPLKVLRHSPATARDIRQFSLDFITQKQKYFWSHNKHTLMQTAIHSTAIIDVTNFMLLGQNCALMCPTNFTHKTWFVFCLKASRPRDLWFVSNWGTRVVWHYFIFAV